MSGVRALQEIRELRGNADALEREMAAITDRYNREFLRLHAEKSRCVRQLREWYDRELVACLLRHVGR